jgi:hypothetical protein
MGKLEQAIGETYFIQYLHDRGMDGIPTEVPVEIHVFL